MTQRTEKVLTSVLYKVQNCFSPGGPDFGFLLPGGIPNNTNNAKNTRLFEIIAKSLMCHKQLEF